MANFAQIDENSIVTNVIVVSSDDCLDSDGSESKLGIPFCKNLLGADTNWVQTKEDGSIRFRYAGIGMKYDSTNDVFYEQQPYPSWVLDTSTWIWASPVTMPDDAGVDYSEDNPTENVLYSWDEGSTSWTRSVDAIEEAPYDPDEDDYPYATR